MNFEVRPLYRSDLNLVEIDSFLRNSRSDLYNEAFLSEDARISLLGRRFESSLGIEKSHVFEVRFGGNLVALGIAEYQDWDSRFFGISCGRVSPLLLSKQLPEELEKGCLGSIYDWINEWARSKQIVFLKRRAPYCNSAEPEVLETHGFHLKEISVVLYADLRATTLDLDSGIPTQKGFSFQIRAAETRDSERLFELADQTFKSSAFFKDLNLRTRGGGKLHAQWLRNLILNDRAALGSKEVSRPVVSVATDRGDVIGFIVGNLGSTAKIELIAVDPHAQGRGVGRALVRNFMQDVQKQAIEGIEAVTWADEFSALALYQSFGLRLVGHLVTYHRWMGVSPT